MVFLSLLFLLCLSNTSAIPLSNTTSATKEIYVGEKNVSSTSSSIPTIAHTLNDSSEGSSPFSSTAERPSFLKVISFKGSKKPFQFCEVREICRVGDGTFLLPVWMKDYDDQIQNCGLKRIKYALARNNSDPIVDSSVIERKIRLTTDKSDVTLLSSLIPSADLVDLAEHMSILTTTIDVFNGPKSFDKYVQERCVTEARQPCSSLQLGMNIENPMLLVDSAIGDIENNKWQKSLLRLIRNTFRGSFELGELKNLYGWRVRSQAVCVRSVLTTDACLEDLIHANLRPVEDFFKENYLKRNSNLKGNEQQKSCKLKILIRNQYGKRFLEGGTALQQAIEYLARENSEKYNVQVQAEVVFFHQASFHEQVSIMQESDIVISPRGDMNANFMFLRPHTTVFEIAPFGSNYSTYQNLAEFYGAKYIRIDSQPDEEVFTACVQHFNLESTEKVDTFLSSWIDLASEFRNKTKIQKRNLESTYILPEEPDDSNEEEDVVRKLRECASYQRSSVDVWDLADRVLQEAATHC